jgi:monofunctional glycosyltransferase
MRMRIIDWQARTSVSRAALSSENLRARFGQGLRFTARWIVRGLFGLFIVSVLSTLAYRWIPVTLTPLMILRSAEGLVEGRGAAFERKWVPLQRISTKLQHAVIAAEDMKFFEHNGFDWEAIDKAREHNRRGKRLRGASTISQQVAKNVFLWPQRSWLRKSVEVYFTTLIELFWSKERILEVYLNVAEIGDGVYGVEAAAQKYFRKSAAQLNSSEAALIAAVLPNPRRMKVQEPSGYVRFRQTLIQRRMPMAARRIVSPSLSSHSIRSSVVGQQ